MLIKPLLSKTKNIVTLFPNMCTWNLSSSWPVVLFHSLFLHSILYLRAFLCYPKIWDSQEKHNPYRWLDSQMQETEAGPVSHLLLLSIKAVRGLSQTLSSGQSPSSWWGKRKITRSRCRRHQVYYYSCIWKIQSIAFHKVSWKNKITTTRKYCSWIGKKNTV